MPVAELRAKASLDGSGFAAGVTRIQRAANGLRGGLGNIKNQIAAAFGTAAITAAAHKTIEYGSRIFDASKRLGVSGERLQEFGYAAEQSGAKMEDVVTAIEKMNAARDEALQGNEDLQKSFERLGISFAELKTIRGDEMFLRAGNSARQQGAESAINPLRDIMGRGAGNLMAAFIGGLDESASEANKMGQVMAEPFLKAMDEIGDEMGRIGKGITIGFAPILVWIVDRFYDMFDGIRIGVASLYGFFANMDWGKVKSSIIKSLFIPGGEVAGGIAIAEAVKDAGLKSRELVQQTVADADESKRQRDEARKQKPDSPKNFDASNIDSDERKLKSTKSQIPSDALLSVGNFLGASQNGIVAIAQRQAEIARTCKNKIR